MRNTLKKLNNRLHKAIDMYTLEGRCQEARSEFEEIYSGIQNLKRNKNRFKIETIEGLCRTYILSTTRAIISSIWPDKAKAK